MGRFLKEARVKVALLGLVQDTADKLTQRLATVGQNDIGIVEVSRYEKISDCNIAIQNNHVDAVCIAFRAFGQSDFLAFLSETRVTHPLVPFCLVGTTKDLNDMPGFHPEWRARFTHYYKLADDSAKEDFDENVGLLRDLFIADSVKSRALGHYDTTPGQIIKIRNAAPYGFWTMIIFTVLAAILGAVVGPVITMLLTPPKR